MGMTRLCEVIGKYGFLAERHMDRDIIEEVEYQIYMAVVELLKEQAYGESVCVSIDSIINMLNTETIVRELPLSDYKELLIQLGPEAHKIIPRWQLLKLDMDYIEGEHEAEQQADWDNERKKSMDI